MFLDHFLYEDRDATWWSLLWGPLITAGLIVVVYPVLSLMGYRVWAWWQGWFRAVQRKLDSDRIVTHEELERWEAGKLEQIGRLTRDIEQKNAYIASLQADISEKDALIGKMPSSTASAGEATTSVVGGETTTVGAASVRQDGPKHRNDLSGKSLEKYLTENKFDFLVRDANGDSTYQERMLFGADGSILVGRSTGAFRWRLDGKRLIFLSQEGEIARVLEWIPDTMLFKDVRSGRNTIERID